MRLNKILSKNFLRTLFIKQNKWHNHSVLVHTLKVTFYIIKTGNYKMICAGLLHDIGKPFSACQDEKDIVDDTYSFTNHEELSYIIIRNWSFISDYTKNLVRYHYILRDMKKCKQKGKFARLNRLNKRFEKLDSKFVKDLEIFLECDDKGK